MASYYSYCGGVGSSEASSTTETTIDSQASPISGGTDLSTINSGGLSQSDILSVLDSVFGASLGLPSSAPSPCNIMAQIEEDEAERDASLSPDQTTTPQSEAYLSGVHLPHLLYAELITTQAALPSTMSAYVGLTSQVTSVNESRSSLLLNISHPSSPLSLCLSAKHVKYLKPAEPKEGDVVRVVRSRGAGTKGHLYMCPNSHQYMIESNIGPLLVSLNDLVRISPLSLSPPSLTPPLSSRPSSLAVTRTNSNTGSVTNSVSKPTPLSPLPPLPPLPSSVITAHTNQPPIYSPVDRSSTYDHTPSPSMSPLSPWGVAYSPMEQEMIPVSPSYLCPSSSVVQPSPYACTTVIRPGGIPTSHRPIYYQATPPNYYHRGQPVCQYMAVPNHMMMVPRPPPPSYQSSVPSSSSTYPSQMRAIPIYRTPHPSLMHHNNSTSSANRPPPPLVPSSNTRQAQHGETNCAKRFNLPDELRSLACGKNLVSKLTSVCSGGRPCLPVELLIEKVVNNLLSKEPPDHWYTPQTKHTHSSVQSSDDVSTESITVSAMCPITKQKMVYPCRGLYCTHLQCFDAKVFLQLALKKHRSYKVSASEKHPVCWRCPVCNKTLCPKQLFIDKHLKKSLETTEATELQCQGKGIWIPIERQTNPIPLSSVIDLTLDSEDES